MGEVICFPTGFVPQRPREENFRTTIDSLQEASDGVAHSTRRIKKVLRFAKERIPRPSPTAS